MSKTVLVVDDEEWITSLVKRYLEQTGFRAVTARTGREAQLLARQEKPDLIVLDVLMPEMDGLEFMRQHRQDNKTPIILLTSQVSDADKLAGLEMGADDYLTKPFSPRELMARVRAVLRRTGQSTPEPSVLRAGNVVVDRAGHIVTRAGQRIDLTLSEFEVLAALVSAPGRAFSRLELLSWVQGLAYAGYERAIDVHIRNLRSKLERDVSKPHLIEAVYGVGYRFALEPN
jgi:DNA-binding response OmpR family regulator